LLLAARQAFEYEIPVADAGRPKVACGDVIEKVRHSVRHGRLVWEIDEYRGVLAPTVIADAVDRPRGLTRKSRTTRNGPSAT
jgi:CYTH domain-containing protein